MLFFNSILRAKSGHVALPSNSRLGDFWILAFSILRLFLLGLSLSIPSHQRRAIFWRSVRDIVRDPNMYPNFMSIFSHVLVYEFYFIIKRIGYDPI